MRMIELYPVGQRVAIGSRLFSAEDIIAFATAYDPQPFHMDAEAARDSVFGGLCASGWHTCANWMASFVDFWEAEKLRLAEQRLSAPKLGPSPGFRDLSWLKPVFAGDTVSYSITALDSRPLATRPGWIVNSALCEGENQNREPVLRFTSSILEFE